MYSLPKTPLPSTSGFVLRPTPTFQPIAPGTPPKAVKTHHTNNPQSVETSPESSLPCGQQTPMGSTSTNNTNNSSNTPIHPQPKRTPQLSPTAQNKQQSPIGTNTNPATQPSIPAAETHNPVSSSPPQHICKSVSGEGVKNSKTTTGPNTIEERLCSWCKQPRHLKKDCPKQPYCSRCRTRGHVPTRCPSKQQGNRPDQEENIQNQRTHREECKRSQD